MGYTKFQFVEDLRTVKLDGEACVLLCVYLFVFSLFIYWLFVCLLFNYFKGPVCWFMHQLCGLAPWGLGRELSVCFDGLALA